MEIRYSENLNADYASLDKSHSNGTFSVFKSENSHTVSLKSKLSHEEGKINEFNLTHNDSENNRAGDIILENSLKQSDSDSSRTNVNYEITESQSSDGIFKQKTNTSEHSINNLFKESHNKCKRSKSTIVKKKGCLSIAANIFIKLSYGKSHVDSDDNFKHKKL